MSESLTTSPTLTSLRRGTVSRSRGARRYLRPAKLAMMYCDGWERMNARAWDVVAGGGTVCVCRERAASARRDARVGGVEHGRHGGHGVRAGGKTHAGGGRPCWANCKPSALADSDERRRGPRGWRWEASGGPGTGIGAAPEMGLCKAKFSDPGPPYGRTTSHPPTFLPLSSYHAQSRPQKLRPRSCAGRLQSALLFFFSLQPPSTVLNGSFQSRALPVAPLLLLALMRQQRPVRVLFAPSLASTSNEYSSPSPRRRVLMFPSGHS